MIPESEKLNVLLVGIDDFARSLFEAAAEESDCFADPVSTGDGYETLALIWEAWNQGTPFDAVISEMEVPGLDAVQFTDELRQHAETRSLFVAILASNLSDFDRVAAVAAGVNEFADYSAAMPELVEKFRALSERIAAAAEPASFPKSSSPPPEVE